jgi:hypothetical protein
MSFKEILREKCLNYPDGITNKPILWDDEDKVISALKEWLQFRCDNLHDLGDKRVVTALIDALEDCESEGKK